MEENELEVGRKYILSDKLDRISVLAHPTVYEWNQKNYPAVYVGRNIWPKEEVFIKWSGERIFVSVMSCLIESKDGDRLTVDITGTGHLEPEENTRFVRLLKVNRM